MLTGWISVLFPSALGLGIVDPTVPGGGGLPSYIEKAAVTPRLSVTGWKKLPGQATGPLQPHSHLTLAVQQADCLTYKLSGVAVILTSIYGFATPAPRNCLLFLDLLNCLDDYPGYSWCQAYSPHSCS